MSRVRLASSRLTFRAELKVRSVSLLHLRPRLHLTAFQPPPLLLFFLKSCKQATSLLLLLSPLLFLSVRRASYRTLPWSCSRVVCLCFPKFSFHQNLVLSPPRPPSRGPPQPVAKIRRHYSLSIPPFSVLFHIPFRRVPLAVCSSLLEFHSPRASSSSLGLYSPPALSFHALTPAAMSSIKRKAAAQIAGSDPKKAKQNASITSFFGAPKPVSAAAAPVGSSPTPSSPAVLETAPKFDKARWVAGLTAEQRDLLQLEIDTLDESWLAQLKAEIVTKEFLDLKRFLNKEASAGKKIFPPRQDIYSWCDLPF